jgi:hypothetical protein
MKTCTVASAQNGRFAETCQRENDLIDQPFDIPDSLEPVDEPNDPSDLEDFDFEEDDDSDWDVFIADDDEFDPQPDRNDFEGSWEPGAWSEEPE